MIGEEVSILPHSGLQQVNAIDVDADAEVIAVVVVVLLVIGMLGEDDLSSFSSSSVSSSLCVYCCGNSEARRECNSGETAGR
jgi:hypothetical protein